MGFSISASTALIFAALFLAFGTFYPAMANGYERVEAADTAKADQNLEQAETDIILNNFNEQGGGGGGNIQELTINISNTGETALTVDETDLLIDGGYINWNNGNTDNNVRVEVENDQTTNLWLPGEYMTIEYGVNQPVSDPNRFKVVTEHGVSVSGDT